MKQANGFPPLTVFIADVHASLLSWPSQAFTSIPIAADDMRFVIVSSPVSRSKNKLPMASGAFGVISTAS
jgi:hypothetical protein